MMQRLAQAAQTSIDKFLSSQDQAEQGYFPDGDPPTGQQERTDLSRRLTIVKTDANTLIPPNDKLLAFRSLTGIDTVPALSSTGHAVRAAPNIGIYPRVVQAEQKAARSYRIFHIVINFCLGAQIIVAASLTALGAANRSRHAVTAFGAMNTVMAGILTYLKGSGLPDRFKNHENEWKEMREHIEQRERELCLVDCPLDAQEEVAIVEDMYNRVKTELDANKSMGIRGHLNNHLNQVHQGHGGSIKTIVHRAATKVAQSTMETPIQEKT